MFLRGLHGAPEAFEIDGEGADVGVMDQARTTTTSSERMYVSRVSKFQDSR